MVVHQGYVHLLLFLLSIGLFACGPQDGDAHVSVCNKDDVVSPKLISVADAAIHIATSDNVIPVEISKASEYQSGHIAKAVNVWRPDFSSIVFSTYGGMICDGSELESFMQNLGVRQQSKLLLYDNKGGCDAMRLAWVLDCYGLDNYQVINGGKAAWKQAGYPTDTVAYVPTPNPDFKLDVSLDTTLYAFRADVLAAIDDEHTVIVDTRESYEYEGKAFIADDKVHSHKKGAFTRGSIPGAVHLNWSDLSDLATDHRIKCTKDLIYDLEAKGITKDKKVIVYCHSGSRSSHTAFVLREVLGYPNVKNYDGSWIEWSYYYVHGNEVPIEKLTTDSSQQMLFTQLTEALNSNNG